MEPFKNFINEQTVRDTAHHLHRAWPGFPRKAFESRATAGLAELELKARVMHLSLALEACLPVDFAHAADIIEASLAPVAGDAPQDEPHDTEQGLAGWAIWPLGEFVARRGLGVPERALRTLHALTQRSTAEFAIRPFIQQHPALTFNTLEQWARDPSAHVRRLVSEGSRPRLPWGMRLKSLIADPSPTLPLLLALQDDASEVVRRSVANHLNDIAKDHPGVVADWLDRHLPGATPQRRALLKHASRSLIKGSDARVLKAWGLAKPFRGEVRFKLSKRRVALGDSIEMEVTLQSGAARAQQLAIDYAVHHVKANGLTSPKVFKGWTLLLAAGERRELRKNHSLRVVTTRRYHAGTHTIELRINGRGAGSANLELQV